ncbi:GYF domain-containing protein [Spironucleus salmonicida]|uniref:GYF domain-containing protein n=1 Tax=Spironucleus salmonicida TaxID=348837 RepID=V6LUF9_9EUKA|nr:GYF domain-containing protein [Spironucleus salmonicida]|eukprot:EST48257.1 hypothetical protein SS50377_11599 [Spironucleus salmonicida]
MDLNSINNILSKLPIDNGIPLELLVLQSGDSIISQAILDEPRQLQFFPTTMPLLMKKGDTSGKKLYVKPNKLRQAEPRKNPIKFKNADAKVSIPQDIAYKTSINVSEYQILDSEDEGDLTSLLEPQAQDIEQFIDQPKKVAYQPKKTVGISEIIGKPANSLDTKKHIQVPQSQQSTRKAYQWMYLDASNNFQGPFGQSLMKNWFDGGHLPRTLPIKLAGVDKKFVPLFQRWEESCAQYKSTPFSCEPLPYN